MILMTRRMQGTHCSFWLWLFLAYPFSWNLQGYHCKTSPKVTQSWWVKKKADLGHSWESNRHVKPNYYLETENKVQNFLQKKKFCKSPVKFAWPVEVNKAQDIRTANTPLLPLTLLQPKLQSEWNTSIKFVQECQYYKDQAKPSHSSQTLQEGTLTNTKPVILSLCFEWRSKESKLFSNRVHSP